MKQKLAAIISLIALTFIMALTSCAPISDNVGGNGTGGNGNSSQITIKLPPIASSAIRALTEEQVSRLQRDTKKYRVTFNGVGQTITREGEGTTYSATFPVGTQVGVTVYCLNAKGEIIVRTVTKNITISSGANSLSFKLSDDGTEIIHESGGDTPGGDVPGGDTGGGSGDDEKPDDDDDSGGDDNPPAPPPPVTEYVNITFNQGFVYTNTVHQSPNTWQAMTGATLPNSGQREKGSSASSDQATATGYVFKGWVESNVQPSGDAPDIQSFNYVQNYDSDMTLYAIWEQIEPGSHSVKFAGGTTTGSSASGLPQDFQQKEGIQATFSGTPTCPGYEFAGWNASSNVTDLAQGTGGSDWTFTMPTSDVTLTAQWNVITYTLSYEANDGQATPAQTETFTVDAGGANVTLKAANTFTRTGYTLSQWNAGNNNWSPSTDISKTSLIALATGSGTNRTITITAQWTASTYKVKYEPNAPSGATVTLNGVTATTQEVERTYGQSFSWATGVFTVPTGYSFAGWREDRNGTGTLLSGNASSTYTQKAEDITVYAQWTEKDYTITYSGGTGSSGSQAGQTISVASKGDELPTKDTTTLSKAGYTFAGWEYNNARYDDLAALRAAISDGTITVTSITLTAVWQVELKSVPEVGDIIMSDGTLKKSTDTDITTANTVAIVYKVENGKAWAIGKVLNSRDMAWASNGADGYNQNISALQEEQGYTDGSTGLEILRNSVSDADDANLATNYPAWDYACNYGRTQNLDSFQTGWYLPSKQELQKVYENKAEIEAALAQTAVSKRIFGGQYYWSSSQYASSSINAAYALNFGSSGGNWGSHTKSVSNGVCAVRQFTY